jgi:hypothetical protein
MFVPVPQDSAEVCSPAFSLTAYGCLLFLAMPVWTVLSSDQPLFLLIAGLPYWTMSGRMGELKTAGKGWVLPEPLPSPPMIPTVGRFDILIDMREEVCCYRWWSKVVLRSRIGSALWVDPLLSQDFDGLSRDSFVAEPSCSSRREASLPVAALLK